MSVKNIKTVRSFYEATRRGDFTTAAALLDAEIDWIEPEFPEARFGGRHHGPDAVLQEVIKPSYDRIDDFRVECDEYLATEERVIVLGRFCGTGKTTGMELDTPFAHVWTIRAGKAIRFQNYTDTAQGMRVLGTQSAPETRTTSEIY